MLKIKLVTGVTLYGLYTLLAWITLSLCSTLYTQSACIIVHGTWAQSEIWYTPAGDFYQAVQSSNDEIKVVDEVVSFSWSGKLGYPAQKQAGYDLANVIQKYDWVILIAHSHGATVGMIASWCLADTCTNGNNFAKIKKFYALGVPIDESVVTPCQDVVEKFYNLFSFGDFVQIVNGLCQRCFYNQKNIVNISVQLQNMHPSHNGLHHPAIGKDLLKIDEYFLQKSIGNFQYFSMLNPGTIYFDLYTHSRYEIDMHQEELLKVDRDAYFLVSHVFFRHKK